MRNNIFRYQCVLKSLDELVSVHHSERQPRNQNFIMLHLIEWERQLRLWTVQMFYKHSGNTLDVADSCKDLGKFGKLELHWATKRF